MRSRPFLYAALGQGYAAGFRALGLRRIAGVDEVGRGPLAGPVLAAAVMLPEDAASLEKIGTVARDSKQLSLRSRETAAELIGGLCAVGYGMVDVAEIDRINIRRAALKAMAEAVKNLPVTAEAVLVDGRDTIPALALPQRAIIKGDGLELAIACASIMAKVKRDRLMVALDREYPGYSWRTNMGYGSTAHLAALRMLGVTPQHRRSFAPVRLMMETKEA